MNKVKLVAADMDHTLLTEAGKLPEGFKDYVDRLSSKGIHFTAASGRPMFTLKEMFKDTRDQMCFISDNGALIDVGDKNIYKSLIPAEDYQEMIHFVVEKSMGIPVLCALDSGYVDKRYQCYESTFRRFFSRLTFVDDMEKISPEANKFTVFFPEFDAKNYLSEVFEARYSDKYHVTIGGDEWIDIMNQGINKGSAIERMVEYFGITMEETMAFGDTYNDIEMLQTVNYSYVMKNAAPEMKQYGKFEADTNDNYGVLKVLDHLL